MKKLLETIYGRDYDLRERIFRMIVLVGVLLASMGIIECVVLMDMHVIVVPLFILLAVMIIALLVTFKYRKIDIAAILVGFLIILLIFPAMFFLSGGLEGGAVIWFALGLFYVFLMFSGKRLVLFLILAITVNTFTYGYGYHHPEAIVPMDSRLAAYLDSLFSMLAVGLAGGIILKTQMKMFNIERSVAQKQQEELEKISESKNSFFASMSHELRTPINTIVGLNEMILRESEEPATKEYAANIQSASKMLLNLINDILDLSQMEMKKMEIFPLEYRTADLFGDLTDMIRVRLAEKKLELRIDIDENLPTVLLGDVKRIHQVLLNILTNAAKYTNEGSVTLSARMDFLEGVPRLRVSVTDTGIGIRKEDLQYLYDSFKRADTRKNLKVEGSGLGLSITKQLVDLMGGEISVDSIYMKGSVFTVILPQKIVDHTPIGNIRLLSRSRKQTAEYRQSFEAPEARILIVDDNAMNSMVESKLLEATKVQTDIAKCGAECLEMTKRKYYHVILLDYMMPEMDGIETLKQLRKQENGLCRDCAVIALSANSAAEAGKRMIEEGFDGYLEKPIQSAALEAEILKFIPEDIIEYRQSATPQEQESGTPAEPFRQVSRRRKRKVIITTDCISDLPEQLIEKYDIGCMYLYVRTASGRFADTLEITSDDLNQYMTEDTSNITSDSVSVEEYEEFFSDMLTRSERVIHISMAKSMGSGYDHAKTAAQCFDHVHIIDSAQISCGQGLVVLYAAKLAMEGYTAKDIRAKVTKMKERVETQFILPSANIYYSHGFLGKTTAKLCGLFQLHPVLKMRPGGLTLTGAGAGKPENTWRRFIHSHLLRRGRISTDVVFISHAGCSVEQQEYIRREILRRVPFEKVIMQRASVSTACNTGIGTFGFAYYRKKE